MACGFPILHLGLCLCTRNRISTCPLCWDGWASTRRIINWNSPINVLDGRLGLRLHLFRARRNGNIGRRIWLNVLVVESHASYDAVSAWRKVPSMQGSHQCSNRWYQKGIHQKEISFFTGLWHPEVFPSMKGSHQCSNRWSRKGDIFFHGAVAFWSVPFHERIASDRVTQCWFDLLFQQPDLLFEYTMDHTNEGR